MADLEWNCDAEDHLIGGIKFKLLVLERVFSNNCETYTETFLLKFDGINAGNLDWSWKLLLLEQRFPSENCHHSYDCCARYYPNMGKIIGSDYDTMVVQQTYNQNI